MGDDVYLRLREFLDGLPGGYPTTESGVELKILKKLFTPEQAEMTMHLSITGDPPDAIAGRCGMEASDAAEMLESMAGEGLIFRTRVGEQVIYNAFQFMVGIYDFHVNTIDRELAELVEEYFPYLEWVPRQFRVVPVGATLNSAPSVATYDRVRDLVKKKETISVAPCICRRDQGLLGNECDRPLETCFTFDFAADYWIENGLGRRIDPGEAVEILDLAEKSALVLAPTNAQDILSICCCCDCCCGWFKVLKSWDRPAEKVQSHYQAHIGSEYCVTCATCTFWCQMGAIIEEGDVMKVDTGRCLGCGLCVKNCPEGAITLVSREGVPEPPKSFGDMLLGLSEQRKTKGAGG